MKTRYYRSSVSTGLLIGAILLFSAFFVLDSPRMSSALTTVPTKMNFQGRLTDASGNIKPNGTYNMKLNLFTATSGGSAVWSEDRLISTAQGVTVTNGLFSIRLGDVTPLPASLFASGELHLEVELPTPATATSASPIWTEGPMSPRNQMATSAYAYNSETLDGLDSADFGQVTSNNAWTGTNTFNVLSQNALLVQNGSSVNVFKVDTVSQRVEVAGDITASGQIQTPKVNFVYAGGGMSGLSYDTNNNIRFGVLNFGGGQGNVSIGQSADQTRGNGDGNVAIGRYAANGSGSYNVALGNGSGNSSSGGSNTSIGESSGASITTGANNTFLGARAGNNDNDGTNVWRSLSSAQNSTAIGSGAQVQSNNSLILGSVYNNTKVGIGITAPTNILSVSPLVLHNSWATGFVQASQAGNTVTASSAQFSASNVGEILMWPDGTQTTITGYTSSTVVTVASSETRAASYFRTHKVGFQVASSGFVGIGILNPGANLDIKTGVNTTTAFRIQDASGTSLMTADTVNMKVTVKSLEVESNITVNGHIISGGSTPTATIPTDCFDLSPNSTVSITGNDTAGKITLNVASGEQCEDPGSNGAIIQVNFSNAYSSAPYISLTRGMDFDNELKEGVNATTAGFTITAPTGNRYATPVVPLGASTYTWYYHVIQ